MGLMHSTAQSGSRAGAHSRGQTHCSTDRAYYYSVNHVPTFDKWMHMRKKKKKYTSWKKN